jgi:thiosulfate/3-mercaptopyruvate sulfurtransferase
VPTGILAAHLDDPDWAVVDCRFDLAAPERGEADYRAGHIPGAVFADLDRHLSGRKTGRNGRHPLPPAEEFAALAAAWGIGAGVQVVVYDQDAGNFASRLWWMLRASGHRLVAVLDGGFAKWAAEGRPTRQGDESRPPRVFRGSGFEAGCVTADEVAELAADPGALVMDARAPERYRGETEPIDPVAGHIPGAVNHFFRRNLAADGTILPPERLRAQFEPLLGAIPPSKVAVYCGSGVFSCQNLLAMEHAGLAGGRLYVGSWSEWCSDPQRPVGGGEW